MADSYRLTRNDGNVPLFYDRTGVTVNRFLTYGADWSNPNAWSLGHVPQAGESADIPMALLAYVDGDFTDTDLSCVHTHPYAAVVFKGDRNTGLKCRQFINEGGALFGQDSDPVRANKTCKLIISDHPLEREAEGGGGPGYDPHGWGGGLISFGGKTSGHGSVNGILQVVSEARPSALKCSIAPRVGHTSIELTAAPTNLQVGDKLYFPSYANLAINDSYLPQWELRTVASVSGTTVGLNAALTFDHDHWYRLDGTTLEERYLVLVLTQSVKWQSENPNGVRGHCLPTDHALWDIRGLEIADWGRTWNDVALDDTVISPWHLGTNQVGRYPWYPRFTTQQCTVDGMVCHALGTLTWTGTVTQATRNNFFDQRRWGVVYKQSSWYTHKNSVVMGYSGAGHVFDRDGDIRDGLMQNCYSARIGGNGVRDDPSGFVNYCAYHGSGFWGKGVDVKFRDCFAFDCPNPPQGAGFYLNRSGIGPFGLHLVEVPREPGDDITVTGQMEVRDTSRWPVDHDGLTVIGMTPVGKTYWQICMRGNTPQTPLAPGYSRVENFRCFRIYTWPTFEYEQHKVRYLNPRCRDAGVWSWGDYTQSDITIDGGYTEGATLFESPPVVYGTWEIKNHYFDAYHGYWGNPVRISPFGDLYAGAKMAGVPSGAPGADLVFRNLTRGPVHAGTKTFNTTYQARGQCYASDTGDPFTAATHTSGYGNAIKFCQRIYVYDHLGTVGNNFRAYHNGQAGDLLAPYSVWKTSEDTRTTWGIVWAGASPWPGTAAQIGNRTNQEALDHASIGMCAMGEVMPGTALPHDDVQGGQAVAF